MQCSGGGVGKLSCCPSSDEDQTIPRVKFGKEGLLRFVLT